MAKKKREICILGYAAETRDYVFALPDSVEIWGINMAHVFIEGRKKGARWFQLHPRDWSTGGSEPTGYWGRPKTHLEFLQKFDGDVWMSYQDDDVPNCKVYSIPETLEALKYNGRQKAYARHYFTSTFAYIMAQAISEKPDKIYLYGINLTALDEYTKQRNCMEYWIGQAEGRGVEIEIPSESALCKAPDYGLGSKTPQEELEKHALDRVHKVKDSYMAAAFDVNTAESMKVETQFWVEQLNAMATGIANAVTEVIESDADREGLVAAVQNIGNQIQAQVQQKITDRNSSLTQLSQKGTAELNGYMGGLKEAQHMLGLLGVIDHRAPALPAVRFPNAEILGKEFEAPKGEVV